MSSFDPIERAAQAYSDSIDDLKSQMNLLEEAITEEKRLAMPLIRQCVRKARKKEKELQSLVKGSSDLFQKPKTRVFHGIKVGFRLVAMKLKYPADDKLVAKIRSELPDEADTLIVTKDAPVKDAIQNLGVKVLRRLGILVQNPFNEVVVKHQTGDMLKMADAMMEPGDDTNDGATPS